METEEMIKRLRAMRGPEDGLGAHLGDGINPGVHAIEIAERLEQLAEKAWMYDDLCK